MVGRVGFEPTVLFRDAIMSRGPATNTAFGPYYKTYTTSNGISSSSILASMVSSRSPYSYVS